MANSHEFTLCKYEIRNFCNYTNCFVNIFLFKAFKKMQQHILTPRLLFAPVNVLILYVCRKKSKEKHFAPFYKSFNFSFARFTKKNKNTYT